MRHEGAEAQGTTVVVRLTILDNWTEHVDEEMRKEFDGQPNALERIAEVLISSTTLTVEAGWCEDLAQFSAIDTVSTVGMRMELLDERGALLGRIERQTSEYCFR